MFSNYNRLATEDTAINITLSIEQKEGMLIAHLLFFNPGAKKFYLDKYCICRTGEFGRDVFSITDDWGRAVTYIGGIAKRKVKPEDFISLDCGESIKTRITLNKGYLLKRGKKYKIQYSVYNLDYLRVQQVMLIESNKVDLFYQ